MPSWGNRSRTNARAFEKFTPVSRATARGSYHGTPPEAFLARKSLCCSAFPAGATAPERARALGGWSSQSD